MQALAKAVLAAGTVALRAPYAALKLLPSRKKVTFISRQSNSPSVDILTLKKALARRHPDYELVMLCRRLDNPAAYIPHMFQQMYHIATSKVVLLDSYCIVVSLLNHKKGLKVIQMWHAIGSMKKFGYAMLGKEEGSDPDVARIMRMHRNYDHILISSRSFMRDYEEGFQMDPSIVEEIPLPKADLLTDPVHRAEKRAELLRRYPWLEGKKNILYCPTFRKDEQEDAGEKVRALIDRIDYEHYNLIYKPHPLSCMRIDDPRVRTEFQSPFEMFFVADYVISDYSSVLYEAGLAGCPVYLYAYDWEEYREKRELNLDLEHGPMLFSADPDAIVGAIERDEFDWPAFDAFIADNVRMPEQGTCCDAIIDLMGLE